MALLAGWFIARAGFFAWTLSPGMAPDEMFHIQVVEIFSRSPGIFAFYGSSNPFDRPLPEFSRFGITTEYPFLYHLLCAELARLLRLDVFEFSSIVVLRLCNVVVSVANLLLVFKVGREFLDRDTRLLFYVVAASILTQTILAAAVSYDPLTNLTATCALYYLLRFAEARTLRALMLLISSLAVGILTKLSMAPLAAVFCAIAAALVVTRSHGTPLLSCSVRRDACATACAFVLVLCTATLLASKYVKYGVLLPTCEQIYSPAACHAFNEMSKLPVEPSSPSVAWWQYPGTWLFYMVSSAYGVRSDIGIKQPPELVIMITGLFLVGLFNGLAKLRSASLSSKILAAVTVGYGLALIWFVGIQNGAPLVDPAFGVNGRYAFPILTAYAVYLTQGAVLPFHGARRSIVIVVFGLFLLWLETPRLLASDVGRFYIEPKPPEFYRLQSFFPGPVYDADFNRIE